MLATMSGVSKTQEDIRNLETFMAGAKPGHGDVPPAAQAGERMEILLHTGIDVALVAAVVMRTEKSIVPSKKMHIKLVVEA